MTEQYMPERKKPSDEEISEILSGHVNELIQGKQPVVTETKGVEREEQEAEAKLIEAEWLWDQMENIERLIDKEHKTFQALNLLKELLPPSYVKPLIDAWLINDIAVEEKKLTELQQKNVYAVLAGQASSLVESIKTSAALNYLDLETSIMSKPYGLESYLKDHDIKE